MRTRKAGSHREIDLHLVIPGTAYVDKAHEMCDHLETDIENLLHNAEVNVHVRPCASARTGSCVKREKKHDSLQ